MFQQMVSQFTHKGQTEGESMYYTHATHTHASITIRHAEPEDGAALRRLAGRDSAEMPEGAMLVALVGDELRAAVPVGGGEAIADPFHPTGEVVRLLTARAAQMRPGAARGPHGGLRRLLGAKRRSPALAPQPVGTLRAFE
jgi:hypothetical protein